jgi:RHS repeat-associated protein
MGWHRRRVRAVEIAIAGVVLLGFTVYGVLAVRGAESTDSAPTASSARPVIAHLTNAKHGRARSRVLRQVAANAAVVRDRGKRALVEATAPLPSMGMSPGEPATDERSLSAARSASVDGSLVASTDGWVYTTSNASALSGSISSGSFGYGQYQATTATDLQDGDAGRWSYTAPREAFVYRVDIADLTNEPAAHDPTCVKVGIEDGGGWETGEWSEAGVVGGIAPWSSCASISGADRTICATSGCTVSGVAGSRAVVEQSVSTTGVRNSIGQVYLRGAAVYLGDDEDPYLGDGQAPVTWFSSGVASWDVSAHDDGLGVSSVSYDGPGAADGDVVHGCTGLHDDRCPADWSTTLAVDTAALAEGENELQLRAHDVIDRASAPLTTTLRVDRSAPQVGYSGAIVSTEGRMVSGEVGIQVDARDGDSGTTRSGVRSIQILLDGVQKSFADQPCAAGSCGLSKSWNLASSELTAGTHVVEAVVRDWAGNQTSRSFDVKVAAGRITSVAEGQRTARRIPLQAEGVSGHDNVRFQYRTSAAGTWSDIPVDTVRSADGTPLSSWPVDLDDVRSPALVWDLVGSPGTTGMITGGYIKRDRSLQIRGVFSGGPEGVTQELWVTLDRSGASTRSATAPIGPGEVDLTTGEFQFAQTDVSIGAYKSDLTVSRTYSSRAGKAQGLLGYGWTVSLPTASAEYTRLENLGEHSSGSEPADDAFGAESEPAGPQPYVIVFGSDGEEIVFSEQGTGYEPDKGYETLKLERVVSSSDPTVIDSFRLTDSDTGELMTFTRDGAARYRLSQVKLTGQGNAASYDYGDFTFGSGVEQRHEMLVTRMIAPAPPGVTCDGPALQRGCRALSFAYSNAIPGATGNRLTKIDFTAWDPDTAQMKTSTVAQYSYVASLQEGTKVGALKSVDDPRRGTAVEWGFVHDAAGRLTNINPTSESGWTLLYETVPTDPSVLDTSGQTPPTGRLKAVQRFKNNQTFADADTSPLEWTVAYDVPVRGAGAPYALGATDVGAWGQESPPVSATAIFRADDVPASPPSSYAKATIHYLDALGREVNVALPGGHIHTTELDGAGNVVRELTAANRARALATGSTAEDHAAKAELIDTDRRFDASGVRLLEEFGPEHDVELLDTTSVRARRHVAYTYDEGAPGSGGPFNLVTTTRIGARVTGETSDREIRTTKTDYDWSLRLPTQESVDPDGLNLRTGTVYDGATGLPVERRMPRSPNGGDASATRTIYWSAQANPEDAACGDRPEWAGSVCKTKPVQQPSTPGLPDLPVATTTYAYLGQPLSVSEVAGTATRQTTYGYDTTGRLTSEEVTSSAGTALGKRTINYASGACDEPEYWRIYDGTNYHEFRRGVDTWCRFFVSSSTSSPGTGATVEQVLYDRSDNVVRRTIGGQHQTISVDPTRGLPQSITDPSVGTVNVQRDPDGQITDQTFVNAGITLTTTYDETGNAVRRRYVRTTGCSADCALLDDKATESIHGQTVTHDGRDSDQRYAYDAAGRLEQVRDTGADGCATRRYVFDADSNRTAKVQIPPAADGGCSETGAMSSTHAYDEADRITDDGYEYDAFGRITRVPAADAGGGPLTTGYYVNDRARRTEQDGRAVTLTLDGLLRPRTRAETNTQNEDLYYGDTGDDALFSLKNGKKTRYIDLLDGDLAAIDREGDVRLQLTNLHGDTVGEIANSSTAAGPNATWETDEFGVPKTPIRPTAKVVGSTSAAPTGSKDSITLATPPEAKVGDVLVAAIATPVIPTPPGWTLAVNTYSGDWYCVYWRVVTASEPSTHTFNTNQAFGKLRGGIVALHGANSTAPIAGVQKATGAAGTTPRLAYPWPTADDTTIVAFMGSATGDGNGGGSWGFPTPLTELWDISNGATTSDRNQAAAFKVLVNGKESTISDENPTEQTGLASAAWAAITVAIAPDRPTRQYRFRYLGAKSRPAELPSGIIGMGARFYAPHIGRFLQVDPVKGGSCNDYEYACADPVNRVDLDGAMCKPRSGGYWGPPRCVATKPYKRPSGATTAAQRAAVQGKPCVTCGATTRKMVADHKNPLVQEWYETGTINKSRMRSVSAVQPQCPRCSAQQGGRLSGFSKMMKKRLGL